MDLRRFTPIVLGTAFLVGCTTTPKPNPAETSRAVAPAAATTTPDPNDPLPPGLTPKFVAFLSSQGLSQTPAKPGEAARLTAAWNNKVIFAPDPTHGGEPVPGFLAKLWLFGPDEAIPITPDGEIIIGMWDNSPKATGGQPALLELWHIDRETAKKFRKRDFMGGEGYTLFLPSSKYHVDLRQVNVVARYNGADGRCLVSPPETLTIDHSATLQKAAEKLGMSRFEDASAKSGANVLPTPAPLSLPARPGQP
ncbi:MAG TPA: hypothetical protein VKD71_06855 [Gemmataceae bacterium]|nr:hypothetical protein [Gemmataceae bacterium]